VKDAFAECFHSLGFENDLSTGLGLDRHIQGKVMEDSPLSKLKSGAEALARRVIGHDNHYQAGINNGKYGHNRLENTRGEGESILETFENNPQKASSIILSTGNWSLESHKRAFSIGDLASSGKWCSLPYPTGTLLAAAVDAIRIRENSYENNPHCNVRSEDYFGGIDLFESRKKREKRERIESGGEIKTYSDSNSESSGENDINDSRGAPSIVIIGSPSSGADLLYSAIASHPQVLPHLKGIYFPSLSFFISFSPFLSSFPFFFFFFLFLFLFLFFLSISLLNFYLNPSHYL
jgi:hypothetical protein